MGSGGHRARRGDAAGRSGGTAAKGGGSSRWDLRGGREPGTDGGSPRGTPPAPLRVPDPQREGRQLPFFRCPQREKKTGPRSYPGAVQNPQSPGPESPRRDQGAGMWMCCSWPALPFPADNLLSCTALSRKNQLIFFSHYKTCRLPPCLPMPPSWPGCAKWRGFQPLSVYGLFSFLSSPPSISILFFFCNLKGKVGSAGCASKGNSPSSC